ncbi:MAG: hypothetical protein WBW62_07885 [Solirubrobacterales bacterium]
MSNPPRPGTVPPRPPQAGSGPQRTPTPRPQQPVPPRPPGDISTRLDGQRGWLNELDRSLKKRSIIALVLTCLAVGVGAAAMYIAITKNSDGDRITALQTRVEALEAASGVTTADPATLIPETGTTLPEPVPPTGTTETTIPTE